MLNPIISNMIYDPKYPEEIPDEWHGSTKPSAMRSVIVRNMFNTAYTTMLGYTKENGNSKECEAVRSCLRFSKQFHKPTLDFIRQVFIGLVCPPKHPFNISFINLSEILMYRIDSFNTTKNMAVLYIHGGGFVTGNIGGFKGIVSDLSNRLSCPIYFPHYRLVPEYTFNNMITDVVEAYLYVLGKHDPSNIYIIADSAGGFLACSLFEFLYVNDIPQPKKAVLYSPVTSLTTTCDTKDDADAILSSMMLKYVYSLVKKDYIPTLTYFDKTFPSILIIVGNNEILLDNILDYASNARQYHVDIRVSVKKNIFHACQCFIDIVPEANEMLDETINFLLE